MADKIKPLAPKERIIVALDLSDISAARVLAHSLRGAVGVYKIGYQLVCSGGLSLVRELADAGEKVFLDLKLLDIPNTVAEGTAAAARLGASFLTVHAYPQALAAAVDGRGSSALKILGVTVLTSMDDADLRAAGYKSGAQELVRMRAKAAVAAGADGVIASPQEANAVRDTVGGAPIIITPGIRPAGTEAGDQKRIATPAEALRAGADYLVIGRPITGAANPRQAADAIVAEVAQAIEMR
mgnify:CR=1 FL=1